jgi:hypothetical protein
MLCGLQELLDPHDQTSRDLPRKGLLLAVAVGAAASAWSLELMCRYCVFEAGTTDKERVNSQAMRAIAHM